MRSVPCRLSGSGPSSAIGNTRVSIQTCLYARGPDDSHVNPMICARQRRPRAYSRVNVRIKGLTRILKGPRAHNTPHETMNPPKRRPIQRKPSSLGACRPTGMHVGNNNAPAHGPTAPSGGIAPSKAPTRRRNASRGLRMAQNPHHRQRFERARTRSGPMRIGCPDADR